MSDEQVCEVEVSKDTAALLGAKPPAVEEPIQVRASEMVVYAENSGEMAMAQTNLIRWATTKLDEVNAELAEVEENLSAAKKHKWRTQGLASMASKARRRVTFYEKVKLALEAGYVIVPSFPVDVFAVRVVKDPAGAHSSWWSFNRKYENYSEHLPPGEGRFVSAQPARETEAIPAPTTSNPKNTELLITPTEWQDVAFPTMLARPRVMEAMSRAMSDLIFDRLCASPGRPRANSGLTRGGDPMVIGQIVMKQGYSEKVVSFVVSWFIDTRDL